MRFWELHHRTNLVCANGRRAVPKVSPFAARPLRADRAGWCRRSAQQEAGGLAGLPGLHGPPAAAAEKLMTLLWGSHFEAQARQNLRQALFRLRRVLGEDALVSDGEVVSLQPADRVRREPVRGAGRGRQPRCPGRGGRPLQGPSAGRHRDPGGGLDRMARRPAPAAGRAGARCHGQARRAGARGWQPRAARSAPPTGP